MGDSWGGLAGGCWLEGVGPERFCWGPWVEDTLLRGRGWTWVALEEPLWGTGSAPGYLSGVPWKRVPFCVGGGISLGDSLEWGGTGMPCSVEVSLKMWEPFWGGGPSCGSEVGTGSPQLERDSPRGEQNCVPWGGREQPLHGSGACPGGFWGAPWRVKELWCIGSALGDRRWAWAAL